MRLQDFGTNGMFVADEPVRKSVKWKNPKGEEFEFDVLIKRVSVAELEARLYASQQGRSVSATTISQSIVLGDTGEPMKYEDAARLDPTFARVLLDAIREVNTAETEDSAKN